MRYLCALVRIQSIGLRGVASVLVDYVTVSRLTSRVRFYLLTYLLLLISCIDFILDIECSVYFSYPTSADTDGVAVMLYEVVAVNNVDIVLNRNKSP